MKWKIALLLLGIVVMSPIIALNVWGIKMSLWANDVQEANRAMINGEPNVEMPEVPFGAVFSFLEGVEDRAEIERAFSLNELNNTRIVNIRNILSIEDVLQPDEAPPAPEFALLYVSARAPQYAQKLCEEVFASLGRRCQVLKASVPLVRNGRYYVSARLAYLPDYDMGEPAPAENAELLEIRVSAPFMYPAIRINVNTPENRVLYLNSAKAVCERVRAQFGNCIVGKAILTGFELSGSELSQLGDTPADSKFDAEFWFRVYAPKGAEGAIKRLINGLLIQALNP